MEILLVGEKSKTVMVCDKGVAVATPFRFIPVNKGWKFEYKGEVLDPWFSNLTLAQEEFKYHLRLHLIKSKFQQH